MQKKIQKISFDLEIIAFELVALNTCFYWERILVIGCQYVKKQPQDFGFKESFGRFKILTVHKCSDTGIFSRLSNRTYCSL